MDSRKIIPITVLREHVPKNIVKKISYIDETLEKKGKIIKRRLYKNNENNYYYTATFNLTSSIDTFSRDMDLFLNYLGDNALLFSVCNRSVLEVLPGYVVSTNGLMFPL